MTTKTVTIDLPELEYAVLQGRAEREGTIEDLVLDAIRHVYGIPVEDEVLSAETAEGLRAARMEEARGDVDPWDSVKRNDGIEA